MGRDKALLEVDGDPMALRVAVALGAAGLDPVVAVGGDGDALESLGLTWVADQWPGEGPLGGLVTGLAATGADRVVLAACDLLALRPATVTTLLGRTPPGAVGVARAGGRRHWHLSVWPGSAGTDLRRRFLDGERALHAAGESIGVFEVALADAGAVADADRPADLPPGGDGPPEHDGPP